MYIETFALVFIHMPFSLQVLTSQADLLHWQWDCKQVCCCDLTESDLQTPDGVWTIWDLIYRSMWSESPRGKTASSLTAELWTAGSSFFPMLKLLFVLKILFKNLFPFLLHFLIGAPFPFSFPSSIKIIQIYISYLLTVYGNYLNKLTLLLLSGCFYLGAFIFLSDIF